jgi:hypothetical protein
MYFYKKANASAKAKVVVCGIWKLETNWERS